MAKENSFWKPVKMNNIKVNKSNRLFGFEMNPKPNPKYYVKPRAPVSPVKFSVPTFSPVKLSVYPARTSGEVKMIDRKPWADTDKDGVPNYFDCKPMNNALQGWTKYGWRPTKTERKRAYKKVRDAGGSVRLADTLSRWRPTKVKQIVDEGMGGIHGIEWDKEKRKQRAEEKELMRTKERQLKAIEKAEQRAAKAEERQEHYRDAARKRWEDRRKAQTELKNADNDWIKKFSNKLSKSFPRGKKAMGRVPPMNLPEDEANYSKKKEYNIYEKGERKGIKKTPYKPDLRTKPDEETKQAELETLNVKEEEIEPVSTRRTSEQIAEDKYWEAYGKKREKLERKLDKELGLDKDKKKKKAVAKPKETEPVLKSRPEEEPDEFYKHLAEQALGPDATPVSQPEEIVSEEKQRQRDYIASLTGKRKRWDKGGMVFPTKKQTKEKKLTDEEYKALVEKSRLEINKMIREKNLSKLKDVKETPRKIQDIVPKEFKSSKIKRFFEDKRAMVFPPKKKKDEKKEGRISEEELRKFVEKQTNKIIKEAKNLEKKRKPVSEILDSMESLKEELRKGDEEFTNLIVSTAQKLGRVKEEKEGKIIRKEMEYGDYSLLPSRGSRTMKFKKTPEGEVELIGSFVQEPEALSSIKSTSVLKPREPPIKPYSSPTKEQKSLLDFKAKDVLRRMASESGNYEKKLVGLAATPKREEVRWGKFKEEFVEKKPDEELPIATSFRKTQGGAIIETRKAVLEPAAIETKMYVTEEKVEKSPPIPPMILKSEKISKGAKETLKKIAKEAGESPIPPTTIDKKYIKGGDIVDSLEAEKDYDRRESRKAFLEHEAVAEIENRTEAKEALKSIRKRKTEQMVESGELMDIDNKKDEPFELDVSERYREEKIKEPKEKKSSIVSEALESMEKEPKIKESMEKSAQQLINEA